ncbi:MAG: DUF2336 domain-containing protein [Alphaproteobacteria bacterium]|nr:DUF2336 domain-containing protein [Alphaproteobacteria bacterium]
MTPADVARLMADPSSTTRTETAGKVARQLGDVLSERERKLAEDIIRLFVKDAEVNVRAALAENLKQNPSVPHDVAVSLAKDVNQVAVPILAFSEVLTDADLIQIVRDSGADKQVAVAQRAAVSEALSEALVETKNEDVVATLVQNEGAKISETVFTKVVDDYAQNEKVASKMIQRRQIPIGVAERLVNKISSSLRDALVAKNVLSDSLAADLVFQAREAATMHLLSPDAARFEVDALVEELSRNGRLTPTILLRAVCMGDLRFFEAALAKLADIPTANAWRLIADPTGNGLQQLITKSRIPNGFYRLYKAAVDIARETNYDGGPNDRERYRHRVIERILTTCEDGFDSDNLEYLVAKLSTSAKAA